MTARLIGTLHFSRLSAIRAAVRVRAPAIVAILCALPELTATAQMSPPHVARYTVDDGLVQNWVDAVAQDSAGFVWAGTPRGLQRFDGYTFLSYSAIDRNAPPELDAAIKSLIADGSGSLWIATERAIFRRERKNARLTRVQLERPFRAWALSSAGNLWVLDSAAISRIDVTSETPLPVSVFEHSSLRGCSRMAAARDSGLWLSCRTRGRVRTIRLDPTTSRTTEYPTRFTWPAPVLLEDTAGRIWLGGNEGLEVIHSRSGAPPALVEFREQSVRALRSAGDDGILVVTETESRATVSLLDYAGRVVQEWALPGDVLYVVDVTVDREGGFWIATSTGGLFRLDPGRGFEHASSASRPALPLASDFVTALHECADGDVWVGTIRGGAYRFSSDWKLAAAYRHERGSLRGLASDEVWDIQEDRAGNHWISTIKGICRVGALRVHCHSPERGDSGGTQLVRDSDGWFWLARTSGSVISFNPETATFGTDPGVGFAMSLYADADTNQLWIASDRLLRARTAHGSVTGEIDTIPAIVSSGSWIYELQRDRRGAMWLASASGLQRQDVASGSFKPVEVRELRGVTVFSMEEDRQGRLWLGTGHGIVLYSAVTGSTRRYRRQDGVLNTEFNRRAAVQVRSGDMVFGGTQGLTAFRPELVTALRETPPVEFTRWRAITSDGPAGNLLEGERELRLATGDRAITIEFSALTFAAGPARYYRYRMEGLDEAWLETSERTVTFGTLPAGEYLLRVQAAAGGENVWHEPGAQLLLHVVPPFWRTTWFSVLLVLVLLAGISILHRNRLRQALATERLRVRISRDLHDDIGSGLSSIALLSDGIGGNGPISERERTQLARIGQSARRMVEDLREIVWAVDPDSDRWQSVVSRMRDVADDLLPGARVSFHAPRIEDLSGSIAMAERRDLFLIYKEMLHNVARHAGASSVEITLTAHRDRIELTISDDGRGFDSTAVRGGTGLRSMQERAVRLGGRVEFVSNNGGGTTARLTLRRT
ncbi:MAG TPA: two-component regulator propeller domain-containing protein [Gemmatimonadaceae bacterium]|nr:two-component regulator propeller domain-containing protein [Gemmatimonadaceae bacterium]